jgi:hypothetical protein
MAQQLVVQPVNFITRTTKSPAGQGTSVAGSTDWRVARIFLIGATRWASEPSPARGRCSDTPACDEQRARKLLR